MNFNPKEHLIDLNKKEYLPVQWRLVWFRELCPAGSIETQEIMVDLDHEVEAEVTVWTNGKKEKIIKKAKGIARFKATITDGKGASATGHGSESAVDFPDYIEKAETKAIGRALAALGYGTQFAPELSEEHRIVDAPVQQSTQSCITPDQIKSIKTGHDLLKKPLPDVRNLSFAEADALIKSLRQEYSQLAQKESA